MGKRRNIFSLKILLAVVFVAGFGVMVSLPARAEDLNVNMEICTETNTEPTITLNHANNSTVFASPISLNFLTDWVYQTTTSRGVTQLAQSTVNFEANQSFSQNINLVVGANTLTIVTNGGCPRHNVTQTLNLNYNPNGISVNHQTTPNASPELTGQVGINNHNIKVTVNGHTYDAINNGDGTWKLSAGTISPALINGVYDVRVQLFDATTDSLLNTVNEIGALTVNQLAPTITVNPIITNIPSPELTGNISSNNSGIKVTINGQSYNATNNGDGTWTLPEGTISPGLANGEYDVLVEAINPITNTTEASATLTHGVTIDTIAPQVTIDTIETTNRQPKITGTVDDPKAIVTVEINGHTYTAINNGDGTWTLPEGTISPLASGEYDLVVTATDPAGNKTLIERVFTVKASGEGSFILPPMTGYLRINRTNIPSWAIYLVIIVIVVGVSRASKRSAQAKK